MGNGIKLIYYWNVGVGGERRGVGERDDDNGDDGE